MPITAIVLAVGSGEGARWDMRSAPRLMKAPVRTDAGSMCMCADVFRIPLAMCGETMPTKPIGPQKAVTAAVSMQLPSIAVILIFPVSAPAISANSSPKSMMSSPLCARIDRARPASRAAPMIAVWPQVVVLKLPADQLWNILRLSALLFDSVALVSLFAMWLLRDNTVGQYISPIVSIFVAIYLMFGYVKRTRQALIELTDKTLPEEEQMKILNILTRHYDSYSQFHSINSHKSGDVTRIDIHLSFEKNTTFEEILALKTKMQEEFDSQFGNCVVNIVVEYN